MDIEEFNIVSYWEWNLKFDTCAICRISLQSINDKDNHICIGNCNHVYHQECINKWLSKRNVCPLCNQDWNTKNINII